MCIYKSSFHRKLLLVRACNHKICFLVMHDSESLFIVNIATVKPYSIDTVLVLFNDQVENVLIVK